MKVFTGKNKWSVAALATSFMLASSVVASGADKPRIAIIHQSFDTEYNVIWADAAKKHPAVTDGSVELTILDGRQDPSVQAGMMDTVLGQKYNAIVFIPVDSEAGNDPVRKAKEAGVPVFGANTLITDQSLYTAFVGSDDVEAGRLLAKAVTTPNQPGNIVILEGKIGHSAQVQRLQGIKEALKDMPDVKILETKTANWSRAEAQALVENWITAHPGKITGIAAENDEMALGALDAVKSAGLDPKKVKIAGIDGIDDALNAVKRGEMQSVLQDATNQAQGLIDVVLGNLEGESFKPSATMWKVNGGTVDWTPGQHTGVMVPWVPVTPENVDALIASRTKK
ncbi:substrate-binding domain-containing protein [Rhizobium sp. 18055]|uniref:substrate-binding domain-containing protein n=1 Tax=Rhizobium sp. 18055 TaxID=2681403 RepID=UPI00135CA5A8|nr:substrate-binding domain-containing protein [Rhizobium sp. 18055]